MVPISNHLQNSWNKWLFKKLNIKKSSVCGICTKETETIIHLFVTCGQVDELWQNIITWIEQKLKLKVKLDDESKILGYYVKDQFWWPMNLILIVTKEYMF